MRNADDAADVVQDAVISMWSRRESLTVTSSAEALCSMSVRNACIDKLRSRRGHIEVEEIAEPSTDAPTDAAVSLSTMQSYINRVLASFPAKQRNILSLSLLSQLSNEEIADVTGESDANVRQVLSRGRLKLRSYFIESQRR